MNKYVAAVLTLLFVYLLWRWNKNRPAEIPPLTKPGGYASFKMQPGDKGFSGAAAVEIKANADRRRAEVIFFNDCFVPYDIIIRGETLYINECERSANLANPTPKTQ